MAAKKKKLKAKVKRLEARLESANAKARRWKGRAKEQEAAAESSEARVLKLQKQLAKERAVSPAPAAEPSTTSTDAAVLAPVVTPSELVARPDASWTLGQLREEARARGLAGCSRKSKAELLAALG